MVLSLHVWVVIEEAGWQSGFPCLRLLTMWSAVSGVKLKLFLADPGEDGLVQEHNVATRISPLFTSANTST